MTAPTDLAPGDVLRSDSGAYLALRERVIRDPRWRCAGWRAERLNNGTGDGHGTTSFIADYLLSGFRRIVVGGPWEVAPRTGGELEERFVSERGVIRRELRKVGTE